MAERLVWFGDGFNAGSAQVGRRVNIHGKTGVVVSGTDMFIDVEWDGWWYRVMNKFNVWKNKRAEMSKATARFGPCNCSMSKGPHHHVDDATIIPWAEFRRSFNEFVAKQQEDTTEGKSGAATPEAKVATQSFDRDKLSIVGISLISEDQIVDENTRIRSISTVSIEGCICHETVVGKDACPVHGVHPAKKPVCSLCDDTHLMQLDGREVMCTFCPTPCQKCRAGGNGPYCTTTPCDCECHQ